jgi:hypothetical protein
MSDKDDAQPQPATQPESPSPDPPVGALPPPDPELVNWERLRRMPPEPREVL